MYMTVLLYTLTVSGTSNATVQNTVGMVAEYLTAAVAHVWLPSMSYKS